MTQMKEIASYGVFGVLTTVVNLVVYHIGIASGLSYPIANTVAFILSVIFAFYTNRLYVFESQKVGSRAVFLELCHFFTARIMTFLVETAGLWVMIDQMGMGTKIPKYCMTIIVIVLNYIVSKRLVFKSDRA